MNFKKTDQRVISCVMIILICLSAYYLFVTISKLKRHSPVSQINYSYDDPGTVHFRKDLNSKNPQPTNEQKKTIDINSATNSQLISLPGIGKKIAQKIIDYRLQNGNFRGLEDLKNVSGIGDKKFNSLKPFLKPLKHLSSNSDNILNKEKNRAQCKVCPYCENQIFSGNTRKKQFKPYCSKCLKYLDS